MKKYKEFITENIRSFLQPKSREEIKNAMKGKHLYDKIKTIYDTKNLKDIIRYPSKKKLYDEINIPFDDYEKVYKDIVDDKKIKFGKVRMNDVEYFQAYKLIVDYIKVIANTEEQINEYVPNTQLIKVFSGILKHLEAEFIFKPFYNKLNVNILMFTKEIFNKYLLIQNDSYEVSNADKRYRKNTIRTDINIISDRLDSLLKPYWLSMHGWKIEKKYVKKSERKFGKR